MQKENKKKKPDNGENMPSVFLGACEIAGMMERLYHAFGELGIRCEFYCLTEYRFGLNHNESYKPKALKAFRHHMRKQTNSTNYALIAFYELLKTVDIIAMLINAMVSFDTFIYIFGRGLFDYSYILRRFTELEFCILRLFRKKMIMLLCGSDSRPTYCGAGANGEDIDFIYSNVKKKAHRIRMLEKYFILIDNPASAHFHTKPYISFNCMQIPIDKNDLVKGKIDTLNHKPVILHAPSNSELKGTTVIRQIIKEIQMEGYELEYIEVENMPHTEVLSAMRRADIVVDELYSDSPMAGLDTEASMNGVPVITCGYFADYYEKLIPKPIPPTVFCRPDQFKERLIWLIQNPEEREKIGRREFEYVKDNCLSTQVANRLLRLGRGDYPTNYLVNPTEMDYVWGWGNNKNTVISCVVRLVDKYGMSALCLSPDSTLYREYKKMYLKNKDDNCNSIALKN